MEPLDNAVVEWHEAVLEVLKFTLDDPEALTSGDLDGAAGRCGVG